MFYDLIIFPYYIPIMLKVKMFMLKISKKAEHALRAQNFSVSEPNKKPNIKFGFFKAKNFVSILC